LSALFSESGRAAAIAVLRTRLRSRQVLGPLAVAGVLLLATIASFGPIVRHRIEREAERRHLVVEVGGVRPGFFAIKLRDVHVRPREVPGIELTIDDLRVELAVSLAVRNVEAKGGRMAVDGEVEDVVDRLRELRKGDRATSDPSPGGPKGRLSAENFTLSWKVPSGGELTGSGLYALREGNVTKFGCEKCSAHHRNLTAELTGAEAELAEGVARRMRAATLHVTYVRPAAAAASRSTSSQPSEPTPPPLPVVQKRGAASARAPASPPPGPAEPIVPMPDLHALRARLAATVSTLASRVPEGGRLEIDGLSAALDVGGEPVALGPGAFSIEHRERRVHVAFSSARTAEPPGHGGTPLSIDADLPDQAGEMSAHLAGGPVSLAVLGVREGTKGLTDVSHGMVSGKGQLVLSEAADALTFDGEVALHSLALKEPRISPEPVHGIDLSLSGRGVLDDHGKMRLDDGQLDMGALHLRTHGTLEETSDHFGVSLAVDVLPAACQALLESAPQGLLPLVRSARMSGTFDAQVNLAFDTRAIDKLSLDYRIGDQCRMFEVPPELSRERFEDSFSYRTYKPDGSLGETTTGPGTDNWTALDDISPFMVSALLTTEDGAFYKHKGFNHAAIRSSVQANLKARRFVRGASTITMQLAKNLFLARDKALSRKIEEVILTDYLEQIFRKDDMMELYLNVVEFGPDVYGITQAASYYFGRKPEELHLAECFFLASLLPSPIRYGKLRDKGAVPETWMRHLKALMEIAAKNGKISQAELEEGLKESVVFVRPGDPPPEPRKPVTSPRRNPGDDDDAWRPLD
jgi:hypothetical protein